MKRYLAGEKTKQKLYETCEKHFYEKGFNESNIRDISNEANINKGSFYYYFDSKFAIGSKICESMGMDCMKITNILLGEDNDDLLLHFIANVKLYWKILYQDPKLLIFYAEITQMITTTNKHDPEVHRYIQEITGNKLTDKELDIIAQVDIGIKAKLATLAINNPGKYEWKMISNYDILTYLNFFGLDKNLVMSLINKMENLLEKYEIVNDEFKIILK